MGPESPPGDCAPVQRFTRMQRKRLKHHGPPSSGGWPEYTSSGRDVYIVSTTIAKVNHFAVTARRILAQEKRSLRDVFVLNDERCKPRDDTKPRFLTPTSTAPNIFRKAASNLKAPGIIRRMTWIQLTAYYGPR